MPDVLIPGGGGGGVAGPTNQVSADIMQVAHGFTTNMPIYKDDAGVWRQARADDAETLMQAVAVRADADNFTAVYFGMTEWPGHGLVIGSTLYLSNVPQMWYELIPPVQLGHYVQAAFEVVDTDRIFVLKQSVIQRTIPNLIWFDDFNRADEVIGAPYANIGNGCNVINNRASTAGTGNSGSWHYGEGVVCDTPDVSLSCVHGCGTTGTGQSQGLMFRIAGGTNPPAWNFGYQPSTGNWRLICSGNNWTPSLTTPATGNIAWNGTNGNRLRVDMKGSSIITYVDDIEVHNIVDTTFQTNTRHGFAMRNATGNPYIDDFTIVRI